MTFKEGEIVKLKTGGPDMVMDGDRSESGKVNCVWFVDETLNSHYFNEESIEYAAEEPQE